MLNVIKKYKKTISIILGIIVYSATLFICGYTCAGNNLDDKRIADSTRLIKEQATTIETLRGQLTEAISESDTITNTGEELKRDIDNNTDSIREVEDGLSTDIKGLSGVIDRLRDYEEKDKVVAETHHSD